MLSLMNETRQYHDFWLRWGLLLILGFGIGAWVGSVYYFHRDQPADFKVTAEFVISRINFTVVSTSKTNGKEAVESIVKLATTLEEKIDRQVVMQTLKMERRNETPLWKWTVLGGVVGVLLVIGGIILWEDTRNYVWHRRQME